MTVLLPTVNVPLVIALLMPLRVLTLPRSWVRAPPIVRVRLFATLLLFAPIWNCNPSPLSWVETVLFLLSRAMPLNWAVDAIRSTSETSWLTSACRFARSLAVSVSFADCTESSRIRERRLWVSAKAPSAVWIRLMLSCAFRCAWLRPRIWFFSFSETAMPAASSEARLIRSPVDSLSAMREYAS